MQRSLSGLLSLLAFTTIARAQDPAVQCAEALLRQDATAAARAAAMATAPASRARLQAALLQVDRRPAAMLAVARAFPRDREADHALLAGAAAMLESLRRFDLVPALHEWTELADEDSGYAIDTEALAPVVLGLLESVAARKAIGGDRALLQEAERLLQLATISRFGLWPARIATDAAWQRPEGLAEDLLLSARPCPAGQVDWNRIDALAEPAWRALLPHAGELKVPALPAGHWLLEARSTSGPWRGVRTVEVSDLDAIALAAGGVMVLAAFDRTGPVAANWTLHEGTKEFAHGAISAAPALIAWPEGINNGWRGPSGWRGPELHLRSGTDRAWLEIHEGNGGGGHGAWLAHAMVDRPLFRPGETVQGRILLRSLRWQGEGRAWVPTTSIAAGQSLHVIVDLGSVGKLELPGHTDAHGVCPFSFVVPAELPPGSWLPLAIRLPAQDKDQQPVLVDVGTLCGTAFFRRPGVRLRVEGPAQVPEGTASAEITAIVEWASGGPAAGLDVRANVRVDGEREETWQLRTGDDGRAVVRVPLAALDASFVWTDFSATGPDGHVAHERHLLQVVTAEAKAEAAKQEEPTSQRRVEVELGPAIVGATCRVTMRGPPHGHGVLAVGRSTDTRLQAIRFDGQGRAHADVPVLRLDWPRLDVTAAMRNDHDRASVPVALRATRPPVIELPAQAQPGSAIAIRVGTDAPGTVVTFAVVDERIFELEPDRTPEPNATLRPTMPDWRWGHTWEPPRIDPQALVGSLLCFGRIPPIDSYMRDLSRAGPAGAGSAMGRSTPGGLRDDFRATASFVTVVAGADGVASTSFTLPSDLTRWRVTVVGIDPEGTSFMATRTLASRQPLAAEPLLPRALRAGDTFALPIAIDRSADAAAAADTVKITTAVDGDAVQVTRAPGGVTVAAGRVANTTAGMRAINAGTARLSLGAELGEHADRSQRALTVGRDAVVRPLQAAALGTGEVAVPLPAGTSPESGMTVDVMLGGAAAWRQLEQSLASYPHGCVEQTLSRLLPYFAAARVAKARGEPLPVMDAAFKRRLHGGLARLRSLKHYRFGFAFWPGGAVDPGMTALALHGLAQLREGGYDPAQADLHIDINDGTYRDALSLAWTRIDVVDANFVMSAEIAVGVARFVPGNEHARQVMVRLLELLPQLPAGLCARLGLVLHVAGDDIGARRCLDRLAAAATPPLSPEHFPGEDPLAVQALQLELATALRVDPAELQTRTAGLLLACLNGHGSTYAHSCALSALAQVLPPTPDVTATIEVGAGAATRTFTLGGKAGDAIHWRAPRAAAVTVRGPAGVPLLVRIATERAEPASDHAAWQTPVLVERELCASSPDATWRERHDGTDLEVLSGPPLVGRPCAIRVRVQSPVPMRFVVVECPLPAGFELSGGIEGVDRYDDRVVFTCDLAAGKPYVRALPVLPMVSGRLLWPPATAAPMYVAGLEGGTAGGFVEVLDAAAAAVPAAVTCFTKPAPPLPPEEVDPFAPYFESLRAAWTRDPVDETASRREVEALLASVPPVGVSEAWRWLASLTGSVGNLDLPESGLRRHDALWRFGAHDRLRSLVRNATLAALALPPAGTGPEAGDQCRALANALDAWPHDALRQSALAQVISRARTSAPQRLLEVIQSATAPVTDAGLCHELRCCLDHQEADVRHAAFASLPAAEQAALPPVLAINAQKGVFDEGVIRMLAASDRGRAELRLRLGDPDFVLLQNTRLIEELPEGLWREVPLSVFRTLAVATAGENYRGSLTSADAAARVASGTFPNAELQQAMAAAVEPAWRAALAAALRQRGVTALPAATRAGDTLWPLWTRALALGKDDAVGARVVLDELAPLRGSSRLDIEPELLCQFLLPPIVAAGTPQQLYAAHESMAEESWRAAWTRLDGPARIALLEHFHKHIGSTFVPATDAEAEAIWRFFVRSGDATGTVETMIGSGPGLACLRRHLAAGEGGKDASVLREALVKELNLDAETLLPPPGEEWQSLIRRARISGFGGEWTTAERAQLDTLRSLRGVAPLVGR